MSFANPYYGFLILLVILIHFLMYRNKKNRFYLDHSSIEAVRGMSGIGSASRLSHFLRYLSITLFIIALMRPREGMELEKIPESGIDIVLAIDTSGSMKALDFKRDNKRVNRLEIVKEVLRKFIVKRKGDRISIVTFGETAFTLAPLTSDIESLMAINNELEIGMAGEATAIGSALGVAINRLKSLSAKSKIIILLTDGRNNAGKVGPIEMSDVAKELGVKIYTIGIGTVGGRAPFEVDSFFGKRTIYQNVDLDVETLTKVANGTGGSFFNATNLKQLNQIYGKIDLLEKREVQVSKIMNYTDHYFYFLVFGIFAMILETVLRVTRLRSFP